MPIRILILEDSELDAELALAELQKVDLDFFSRRVEGKEDFILGLHEFDPQVILADNELPDFDGQRALNIARELRPDVPFIYVSGSITEEMAVASLRSGATDYIIKDRLGRLGPAVQRALREVSERSQRKKLESQFRQAQKMEALGRLAAGVAHDFNNYLTVILGYTDELSHIHGIAGGRSEEVDEIRKAGEAARSLTKQLMSFSRKTEFRLTDLDLNTVIRDMTQMLTQLVGRNVELSLLLEPELGRVMADRGGVQQILMNLATNARDAMPEGGKLTMETSGLDLKESRITSHVTIVPGKYTVMTVRDSGVGMTSVQLMHLFEPFYTTKKEGRGTGLGLSTIHGIVKQMEGVITVDSRVGEGTTFKIYLPRVDGKSAARVVSRESERRLGMATVLLVDDQVSIRMLAGTILKRRGYTVLDAGRGDEAMAVAERHKGAIDLLLTDLVMPGMSGQDLYTKLLDGVPGLRVLYMSGNTDPDLVAVSIDDPNAAFLQKPFTPEKLLVKVRKTLDGG